MFETTAVEEIKTYFMFNNFFLENNTVYEIIWKNIIKMGKPQMTKSRIRIAWCIPKATNTHSEYVIIIAFSTGTIVARTRLIVT